MDVRILVVPYDSGHRAVRMGRGPLHLIEYGLEDALADAGHEPRIVMIDSDLDPPTETAVAFDLARSIAREVREARASGEFPLVLAGNCSSALGTVAGLASDRTGVLWFDAHADLNTPETTRSGFLDGMATATLTGRCWTGLTGSLAGFAPVDDSHFAFVGVRDLDPPEEALLASSEIGRITAAQARSAGAGLDGALSRFEGLPGLYLHVDLDVLDPAVARANAFAAPDGLTVAEVIEVVARAAGKARPLAAAVTAFDPAYDERGRDSAAATAIITGILAEAAGAAATG
ncbi:MAG TPA: arginase family protein [Longimicrobiales bacterium]|nr:arginase family protein [Longimicrobiales bacterium]